MKKIALISAFVLAVLFFGQSPVVAACVSPTAQSNFTACPTGNPVQCNIYNEQTGTTDLSCCAIQSDCNNFTTPAPAPSGGGSSTNPFCPDGTSINTAIGCIPTDPGALFTKFFKFGIGIAGGIAFLLILFGGFQILTSAGNPEHMNEGKELVSSAIAGLLLIIFSVFLLKFIGITILGIPGFG